MPSRRRLSPVEGGWVIPRLDFLRVLVKHYVHMEHNLVVFLKRLFKKHDRYVSGAVIAPYGRRAVHPLTLLVLCVRVAPVHRTTVGCAAPTLTDCCWKRTLSNRRWSSTACGTRAFATACNAG